MALLKKVKAATLVETLTAAVLIVLVFMMSSLILNNVFSNMIKQDHSTVRNRVTELKYQYLHRQIKLPYHEDFERWEIMLVLEDNQVVIYYEKR